MFFTLAMTAFFATVGALYFRTFVNPTSDRALPRGSGAAPQGRGAMPQGNQFSQKVAQMKQTLTAQTAQLVAWETDTLSLLCADPLDTGKSGLFTKNTDGGLLGTIYQEPVAAFTISDLGNARLLLVQTKSHEYLYRKSGQQTDIWVNSTALAVLAGNSILSADNTGKLLGQLQEGGSERILDLDGTPACTITFEHREDEVNPRAVQMLRQVQAEEQKLLQALVFYYVLAK